MYKKLVFVTPDRPMLAPTVSLTVSDSPTVATVADSAQSPSSPPSPAMASPIVPTVVLGLMDRLVRDFGPCMCI